MELWGQKPAARAVKTGVGEETGPAERRDGEIVAGEKSTDEERDGIKGETANGQGLVERKC